MQVAELDLAPADIETSLFLIGDAGEPDPRDREPAVDSMTAQAAIEPAKSVIVFLGVPEHEVAGQPFTHHQLLHDYSQPLGSGNNMFISVSAPGDTESAPSGYRAVMISTHCDLEPWAGLADADYEALDAGREHLSRYLLQARGGDFATHANTLENGKCAAYCDFHQFCRAAVNNRRKA